MSMHDIHDHAEWHNKYWRLQREETGIGVRDEKLPIGYNVHCEDEGYTKNRDFPTIQFIHVKRKTHLYPLNLLK